MRIVTGIITVLFLFILCSNESSETPVSVGNFHKVSNELYRSAQPSKSGMKELEELGVKSLINLRLRVNDKRKIKGTELKQYRIPIKTTKLSYDDMVEAMQAFDKAEKPALVHCRRGSDRTGCFIACYRILFEDWSKEKAIEELLNEDLGYYKNLFPNILEFVQELDKDQFKKDVFKN